jgi:ribulose kinase
VAAGWHANPEEAAQAMCNSNLRETQPVAKNHSRYTDLLAMYRELYPALRETFSRLSKFTSEK